MSQETYSCQITLTRNNHQTRERLNLTFDQAAGMILASTILNSVVGNFIQIAVPSRIFNNVSQLFTSAILFVSSQQSHANILDQLLTFNPSTQVLYDILSAADYTFRHPRNQRYMALFLLPHQAYIIQFNTLEFLQGMITICNWARLDYHNIIPAVYDVSQPMTIE
jgi:hypothetical protein